MAFPIAALLAGGQALLGWLGARKQARQAGRQRAEQYRLAADRDRITPMQNQIRGALLRAYGYPESMIKGLSAPQMEPNEDALADAGPGFGDLAMSLMKATKYLPPRSGVPRLRQMNTSGINFTPPTL